MMRISRALSAGQAKAYHETQFANAREEYYSQGQTIAGQWDGQLAAAWGLIGSVTAEQFARLADGQHPHTGHPLIRHLTAHDRAQPDGSTKTTVAHRAGWDLTIGAPKSVSLAALIGGDDRIRLAHRAAVQAALRATEQYVQARVGSGHPSQTTGRWVAATFEHDSARPVEGYAAPHLHTHVVVFNMTDLPDGRFRSLQPLELFRTTGYATAVYRSVLTTRLQALGYEIDRGEWGAPDIKGFSRAYLEASSPRSAQMQEYLTAHGVSGARAADIAALATRDAKADAVTPEEMIQRHQAIAAAFGFEADAVVQKARAGVVPQLEPGSDRALAERAMDYAVARNTEREAAPHAREYLRDALIRSMGDATTATVHRVFQDRITHGYLVERPLRPGHAGHAYTTPEMQQLERDNLAFMRQGRTQYPPLVPEPLRFASARELQHLSADQRVALQQIFANRDGVQVLDGVAGSGKTVALAAVKAAAERAGYTVEGFAPTGRAARHLAQSGMPTSTLQKHLQTRPSPGRHLYVLDESSLASTTQIHRFLERLGPTDRVLLVGDARQHQAVDAGRPFDQLQEAGVATSHLTEIRRQTDPALRSVVHQLSTAKIHAALRALEAQGRVHEIEARGDRLRAVAQAYLAGSTASTLVIAPDNQSREHLNADIRAALRTAGRDLDGPDQAVRVLVPRHELTGADRAWAGKYQIEDVLRFSKKSETFAVTAGEYVRVTAIDPRANRITVERADGSTLTYEPRRLQGVAVYRETERLFAVGDRIQFTAPVTAHRVANRELGTVATLTPSAVRIKLDDGRVVRLSRDEALHLEHGYAVTSHSAQGQTVDRVLLYLDPERAGEPLVNRRLAYVAVSRARLDGQIFTPNREWLYRALNREYDKSTAIDVTPAQMRRVTQGVGIGYSY